MGSPQSDETERLRVPLFTSEKSGYTISRCTHATSVTLPGQLLNMTNLSKRASLGAQRVKRLPTMRETWVRSLGREDPQEKETATHSSTLAWKIPWMEEPSRLQSMGWQRVRHN